MNITFVTHYDSTNVHSWSGIPYHMQSGLARCGVTVNRISGLQMPFPLSFRLRQIACRLFNRKRYLPEVSATVLRSYADQVAAQLRIVPTDVVFSPGTREVAYLNCQQPVVFWTDATFASMLNFYESFSGLASKSIVEGNAAEQSALERCSLAIYSSAWAAESAVRYYKVPPSKVKVIPFGANVDCCRTIEVINDLVKNRSRSLCKLLFAGVEWNRKGGDMAVAMADRLNELGLPTELTVLGCKPPNGKRVPEHVRVAGFVSKATPEGRAYIDSLFSQAHFLVLPTTADCTPMVIAEANSFGVPAVATDVGGIPSIITDELNGKTFGLNAGVDSYCEWIKKTITDPKRYQKLALSSFAEYQTRLNWDVGAKKVAEAINGVVQNS